LAVAGCVRCWRPNGLAVTEATLAALDGLANIDTVMHAVETVSAGHGMTVLGVGKRSNDDRRS